MEAMYWFLEFPYNQSLISLGFPIFLKFIFPTIYKVDFKTSFFAIGFQALVHERALSFCGLKIAM